jgi:hypothetical protein
VLESSGQHDHWTSFCDLGFGQTFLGLHARSAPRPSILLERR